jgi:hypothetical protein
MEYNVPWAAILGNHDQESTMTREELMTFMSLMDYSVSQVNPPGFLVHGFGNYHVGIHGPFGSGLVNTSLLNLYTSWIAGIVKWSMESKLMVGSENLSLLGSVLLQKNFRYL